LNDDIEALKKTLNDNGAKLTGAEKNQRLQELGAKEKQLQREAEDFKNDSQSESQQAFSAGCSKGVLVPASLLSAAWVRCCAGTRNGYRSDSLVRRQRCRYNRSDH
jgi:hypothetical protein